MIFILDKKLYLVYYIHIRKNFQVLFLRGVALKNTAFIISEYDPFHNGHKYHIEKTRQAGAERIICLMSGNFVQRGDIAFCDKHSRARFAVENGADIVFELPLKNVLSGASYFAEGASQIIKKIKLDGTLSFGSSADTRSLTELSAIINSEAFKGQVDRFSLENGCNHAIATYKTLWECEPEKAEILNDPNNILALEYIKATGNMDLFSVTRNAVNHDSDFSSGGFSSAKHIRELIYNTGGLMEVKKLVPENVYSELTEMFVRGEAPTDKSCFSRVAVFELSRLGKSDFAEINGVNQGLENRIYSLLRESSELYSLYDRIKTKRFTHSRIRQIMVSSILGIKKAGLDREVPYIRVLGFNSKGREIIKEIRESCEIPLVMNLSEAPECPEKELDYLAGKLFDICRPRPLNKNTEFASKPYVSG